MHFESLLRYHKMFLLCKNISHDMFLQFYHNCCLVNKSAMLFIVFPLFTNEYEGIDVCVCVYIYIYIYIYIGPTYYYITKSFIVLFCCVFFFSLHMMQINVCRGENQMEDCQLIDSYSVQTNFFQSNN